METIESHKKLISDLAHSAFKDHEIVSEQTGVVSMWYCGRSDGSNAYSFRIIFAPGCIVVYGDVGDGIYHTYNYDTLSWLRRSANSPQYLIEKMGNKKEKFFPAEAYEILSNMRKESIEQAKIAEEIRSNWNTSDFEDCGHEFQKAFWEAGVDTEITQGAFDYDSGVYWSIECLKKFIELLDNEQKTELEHVKAI
jgi:hypothetical protein